MSTGEGRDGGKRGRLDENIVWESGCYLNIQLLVRKNALFHIAEFLLPDFFQIIFIQVLEFVQLGIDLIFNSLSDFEKVGLQRLLNNPIHFLDCLEAASLEIHRAQQLRKSDRRLNRLLKDLK